MWRPLLRACPARMSKGRVNFAPVLPALYAIHCTAFDCTLPRIVLVLKLTFA